MLRAHPENSDIITALLFSLFCKCFTDTNSNGYNDRPLRKLVLIRTSARDHKAHLSS